MWKSYAAPFSVEVETTRQSEPREKRESRGTLAPPTTAALTNKLKAAIVFPLTPPTPTAADQ